MLYSFKGKAKDLLQDIQDKMENNGNQIPTNKAILEKFGNLVKSLGAKNVSVYKDLEGIDRLKYYFSDKCFVVGIEQLYEMEQ